MVKKKKKLGAVRRGMKLVELAWSEALILEQGEWRGWQDSSHSTAPNDQIASE
jgi:hypothetical protein